MNERKCEDCYWFGRCDQTSPCEFFDPLYMDAVLEAEYEQDLLMRHHIYMRQIEDQDG